MRLPHDPGRTHASFDDSVADLLDTGMHGAGPEAEEVWVFEPL